MYLLSVNTSLKFTESWEKIKEACTLEFAGSKLHKFIHVLVGKTSKMIMNDDFHFISSENGWRRS